MSERAQQIAKDNGREELNEMARNQGIASPEDLNSKEDVAEAIVEAQNRSLGDGNQGPYSVVLDESTVAQVQAGSVAEAVKKAKAQQKEVS